MNRRLIATAAAQPSGGGVLSHEAAKLQPHATPLAKWAKLYVSDARAAWPIDHQVDCVVTSPPYWRKRNYGPKAQIGLEIDPDRYAERIGAVLAQARDHLTTQGNIFVNIGDTYEGGELVGIPDLVERAARANGLQLRNRIVWAKKSGIPEPRARHLASRHEYVLHFTKSPRYYYDLHGYSNDFGSGANPGDVWQLQSVLNPGSHLAPFPPELARRAITLGCPALVDMHNEEPVERIVVRTFNLDPNRPQAKRALTLAKKHKLTHEHLRAVQAVGIADAGKAKKFQSGAGKNSKRVLELAGEAKDALGGYFREFTFAKKRTAGWKIAPDAILRRAIVMDPFAGTATTLRVGHAMGRCVAGLDVKCWPEARRTMRELEGAILFPARRPVTKPG
jgi:DNA modification methylase